MERQEILALLDGYIAALNTKAENEDRIRKLQRDIGITYDPNDGYAFIRFFWPFLVGFPFGAAVIIVFLAFLTKVEYGSEIYFCYFIGIIIYFALAIFFARLLRKNANKKLYQKRVEEQKNSDAKANARISELQKEIEKADEFIAENKDYIPEPCRNVESLKQIKSKIFRGKAETIEEAINN